LGEHCRFSLRVPRRSPENFSLSSIFIDNIRPYFNRRRVRPGFDSLAESDQKTLKVGIHSFPA